MSKATETVQEFLDACHRAGWRFSLSEASSTVSIWTDFDPGDRSAYVKADGEAYSILSILPHRGSIWGTTGDGVGGHVGLERGFYELKVSGVQKRVLKALATEITQDRSPDNQIDRA